MQVIPSPQEKPINQTRDVYLNWQAEKEARLKRDSILDQIRTWYNKELQP